MGKVFSDSFLGLTGESESLTVLHPPTKLSDHLHLFFIRLCHVHGHQETQDLNQVPLCASAMRDCAWQWDLLDFRFVLTRGWEAPTPIVENRGGHPRPTSLYTENRPKDTRPDLPTSDDLSVFLAETYNLIPSLGTAICDSVLYPSRGLNRLLVHNKN